MPVKLLIDPWNPAYRYRFETFCYGPESCTFYKAGAPRKVPGRKGMTWVEEDGVDEQASLRSRERFWDIRVPKIDSIFDNSLVPRPSWSPGVPPQHRKLVAATHRSPI